MEEVKGIYAGLVMVATQCIEVDRTYSANTDSSNTKPNPEQWRALIHLHRTLLHEYDDFFLASQHLSASPALRRLAAKYTIPSRMLQPRMAIPSEPMSTFSLICQRMSHLLYNASESLLDGADGGELLRWLRKTEDMFLRLCKRFSRHRFQLLVYVLHFYRLFFEFPSGIRHTCTTMPWTIWPALVVLWGVCWMFIQQRHEADGGIVLPSQLGGDAIPEGLCSRTDVHLLIGC